MADAYSDIMNLVTQLQTDGKAQQSVQMGNAKQAAQEQQDAQQAQMAATGIAAQKDAQDKQAIADGVNNIQSQLSADPTDPTSLMARNNVAMSHLNEQLLAQYQAIENVQGDNSVIGVLNRTLNLPSLQRGAAQLEQMHSTFANTNTEIAQQMNNQGKQITDVIQTGDVQKQIAERAAASYQAQAGIAKDQFTTAKDMIMMQDSVSAENIQQLQARAEAWKEAQVLPLQKAIMNNTLVKDVDQTNLDKATANMMGWSPIDSRNRLAMLRNDPQAANAIYMYAVTGKFNTPADAAIVRQWMNPKNLMNPDGTPMPQYAAMQEVERLSPRVDSTMQGFYNYAKTTLQLNDSQLQQLQQKPGMFKPELDKYLQMQTDAKVPVNSDAINMNPSFILSKIPALAAQTPLIKEIAGNLPDATNDITPENLIGTVVKANMNVPNAQLAQQLTTYYQNAYNFDKNRSIYPMLGLQPPNTAAAKVSRMSKLSSFGVEMGMGFPTLGTAENPGNLDLTNPAAVEDYIREVKLKAEMNAPTKGAK